MKHAIDKDNTGGRYSAIVRRGKEAGNSAAATKQRMCNASRSSEKAPTVHPVIVGSVLYSAFYSAFYFFFRDSGCVGD